VFLKCISSSARDQRYIHWDSSKAPLLLDPPRMQPFREHKVFLRYVPLHDTRGISFAFNSVHLLAIIAHEGESDQAGDYSEVYNDAVWIHCPLRNPDEKIIEIWSVQNRFEAYGWRAFIVRNRALSHNTFNNCTRFELT
jgi:hypothetical protein